MGIVSIEFTTLHPSPISLCTHTHTHTHACTHTHAFDDCTQKVTFAGLHADRLPTLASFLGAEPTAVIYGRNCGKCR